MDVAKLIKVLLVNEGENISTLADKLGTSNQNLGAKLKRNNLSTKEMKSIADALGYDLKIDFIKKGE